MKKKLADPLVFTSIVLVCMWGLSAADMVLGGGGHYEIDLGGGVQYHINLATGEYYPDDVVLEPVVLHEGGHSKYRVSMMDGEPGNLISLGEDRAKILEFPLGGGGSISSTTFLWVVEASTSSTSCLREAGAYTSFMSCPSEEGGSISSTSCI